MRLAPGSHSSTSGSNTAPGRPKEQSSSYVLHGRWDRDPLARAVTKLVSNDKKETVASAPTLQKALTLMTDVKESQHVHPNHIMIPLDSDTKHVLGGQPLHSPD